MRLVTSDLWHMTCDTWLVTDDMWHMCDTWHVTHEWHMTCDTWVTQYVCHFTCDKWHVTHDMWHMTCDTWHVTGMGRWTFSQNFSSLTFTVWEWRFVEDRQSYDDISTNHQWMNEWINQSIRDGGDCRTAPASPGLLTIIQETLNLGICG